MRDSPFPGHTLRRFRISHRAHMAWAAILPSWATDCKVNRWFTHQQVPVSVHHHDLCARAVLVLPHSTSRARLFSPFPLRPDHASSVRPPRSLERHPPWQSVHYSSNSVCSICALLGREARKIVASMTMISGKRRQSHRTLM